jgi:hypothetical protein
MERRLSLYSDADAETLKIARAERSKAEGWTASKADSSEFPDEKSARSFLRTLEEGCIGLERAHEIDRHAESATEEEAIMFRRVPLTLVAPIVFVFAAALSLPACAEKPGPAKETPAPARAPTPAPAQATSQNAQPAGKMTKVVFRTVMPGLSADNPDTKPKTLYRLDDRYGRIEHPLDPVTGVQALVIVASPDGWFVDRAKQTATHFLDPGPTYNFHALIAPHKGLPKEFHALEFGRELEFVEAHGARVTTEHSGKGTPADIHEADFKGVQVYVSTDAGTRKVRSVVVARGKTIVESVHYDEYETDLPPDLSLFATPTGVRITEQQAQQKPTKKH